MRRMGVQSNEYGHGDPPCLPPVLAVRGGGQLLDGGEQKANERRADEQACDHCRGDDADLGTPWRFVGMHVSTEGATAG